MATQKHSEVKQNKKPAPVGRYGAENFLHNIYQVLTPEQRAQIRATISK